MEYDKLIGSAKSITILPLCATHSFTSKVTKEPTCEEAGVRKHTCSKCGYYYTESIVAKGHKYKFNVIKPTYTSEGYTEYTCTQCGKFGQKDHTQMIPIPTVSFDTDYTATSNSITLSWKQNKEAAGYCIYQYDAMSEKWVKIKNVNASTNTYKVTKLKSGVDYAFKIQLYMVIDGYTYYSDDSPALNTVTKIDKVTWKSKSVTTKSISLNWNENSSASGYCIYRYDSKTKKWKSIKTITSGVITTYKVSGLQPGTSYRFKIRSYVQSNEKKHWSDYSAELKVVTTPEKVTWKKYTATTTSITLKWNKNAKATGYCIYRYDSTTKKWKSVKTITSGSKTSYKVSGLKAGKSYSFRIKAYVSKDGSKYWSAYSATKKTTTKPVKAVISKVSTPKKKTIKVYWKKVSGASGYEVQISTSKKFSSSSKYTKTYTTTSLNKTISSLTKGKKYYIRVRAYRKVDGVKQYGSWSTIKGKTSK